MFKSKGKFRKKNKIETVKQISISMFNLRSTLLHAVCLSPKCANYREKMLGVEIAKKKMVRERVI